MRRNRFLSRTCGLLVLLPVGLSPLICRAEVTQVIAAHLSEQAQSQTPSQEDNSLIIESDSALPDTSPGAAYQFRLIARGGVPGLRWRMEQGALPPGIKLDPDGLLNGAAEHGGEFQFTVSVTDRSDPHRVVRKQFTIRVHTAMSLDWKSPAHVNGSRIEGSVEVSNSSPDDIDLTFDVKAVQENGRATEIGYQHFLLKKGTTKKLPFGENLPHGGYVVYVNASGEVTAKNLIYRESLQTGRPLQVTVGP